jgi:AcrR family transcriptional regulator
MMTKVTQAHIDQRRDDIVRAARELFSTKGWQATSMQEVASEAGISTGAVYRYFASKEEILLAVFHRATDLMQEQFDNAAAKPTVLETFREVGLGVLTDPECGNPQLQLEVSLAGSYDKEVWGPQQKQFTKDTLAQIQSLVGAAQANGEIAGDLDPVTLAQLLYVLVPGISALRLQMAEEPDIPALLDLVLTLLARSKEGATAPNA